MWKTAEEFLNDLSKKQREEFKEKFISSLGPESSKKYDELIKQRLERDANGDVIIKLKDE